MVTAAIKKWTAISAPLLLVFLTGCSQLSPQQIDFKPSIQTEGLISAGGTASLLIVDKRPEKVIGVRGGAYSQTSTIVSKRPLPEVIESIATQVLDQAGVELTTAFPEAEIQINLDKLSYVTEDYKTSIKRTTAAASMSIQVKKGGSTFTNGYSTTQYVDTVGFPSEEKNVTLLNDVFESVLQRMFTDKDMEAFLK